MHRESPKRMVRSFLRQGDIGIEKFGESLGYPSNIMKHSAYIHVGSSGGAAVSEDMKLIGIVPGGSFSPDGDTFRF